MVTSSIKLKSWFSPVTANDASSELVATFRYNVEKLLKPFERLDTARSNAGGSGLGLAIADRIAKLHHGKIELINRPEGGLEARLTIPIVN